MIDFDPHKVDRIKLPVSYDHALMKADYEAMGLDDFVYYSSILLNIPHPDYAPTYEASLTRAAKERTLAPYLMNIVDEFNKNTRVTLARVLRLESGAVVAEHTDPTLGLEIEDTVLRLTIPICGGDGVTFYLNQKPVPMLAGECWYLKLSDPHSITNYGPADRVNFTIDVIQNDWVLNMINNAYAA